MIYLPSGPYTSPDEVVYINDLLFLQIGFYASISSGGINVGHKKINAILLAVLLVLLCTFGFCIYYSSVNPMFSFLNTISTISSFFVAVLTVIYVYTSSNQMDLMRRQLDEMRIERLHREEPILDLESTRFIVERPNFYYSPPEDEFSFLSRYHFSGTIRNISSFPALFVDVSARLIITHQNEELILSATSRRINVIPSSDSSDEFSIMFTGDNEAYVLSKIRSSSYNDLPNLEVNILYKSASGGCYKLKYRYAIDYQGNSDEEEIVKNWHTAIAAAPVEEKETLQVLQNKTADRPNYYLIKKVRENLKRRLIGGDELAFQLVERPQKFSFKTITDTEYEDEISHHQYGHYIGTYQQGSCSAKRVASTGKS